MLQVALYTYGWSVTRGAALAGVRQASVLDGSLAQGEAQAGRLLRLGLGAYAGGFTVTGAATATTVTVEVQGGLPLLVPWVGQGTLPLHAAASRAREGANGG